MIMNKLFALAAAASVALTGTAFAHPHEGGDGKQTVEKVIVMTKRDGAKGDGKHLREFRMMQGPNGEFACPNGNATKIDETTGKDRTKVLICADDKLSNAERAKKLEETLAELRGRDGVSGEHRAKVEAALQEAIARLRAGN
jgi:hypothetical protein